MNRVELPLDARRRGVGEALQRAFAPPEIGAAADPEAEAERKLLRRLDQKESVRGQKH